MGYEAMYYWWRALQRDMTDRDILYEIFTDARLMTVAGIVVGGWLIMLSTQFFMQWRQKREVKQQEKQKTIETIQESLKSEMDQLYDHLRKKEAESTKQLMAKFDLIEDDPTQPDEYRVLTPTTIEFLYDKGKKAQEDGDRAGALESFLCVLYGIGRGSETRGFLHLVDCIHRVATLYHEMGDAQEAVKFLQAEKFVYENALLHFAGKTPASATEMLKSPTLHSLLTGDVPDALQRHRQGGATGAIGATGALVKWNPKSKRDMFIARMETFTELAKLYGREKNPVMGMNYAIKAINMRKRISGDKLESSEQYKVLLDSYVALSEWQAGQRKAEADKNRMEQHQLRSFMQSQQAMFLDRTNALIAERQRAEVAGLGMGQGLFGGLLDGASSSSALPPFVPSSSSLGANGVPAGGESPTQHAVSNGSVGGGTPSSALKSSRRRRSRSRSNSRTRQTRHVQFREEVEYSEPNTTDMTDG